MGYDRILHDVEKCLINLAPPILPIRIKLILNALIDTRDDLCVKTIQRYLIDEGRAYAPTQWDILKHFRTIDATTIYLTDVKLHVILFNQKMPIERKKWTLAHELGHIRCGHFQQVLSMNRQSICDAYNARLEREADYFARCLLAPPWMIFLIASRYDRMDAIAYYTILRSVFRLSKEASFRTAISMHDDLRRYRPSALRRGWRPITQRFLPFIKWTVFEDLPDCDAFYAWTLSYLGEYNLLDRLYRAGKLGTPSHLQLADDILCHHKAFRSQRR